MRRTGGMFNRSGRGTRHDGAVLLEVDAYHHVTYERLATSGGLSFAPALSIEIACMMAAKSG
jgi:hypothetical protein